MSKLEERLRSAARAVALAVPEDSAPPLRLPAHRYRFPLVQLLAPVRRRLLHRVREWLTPLGAATAVLGAVAVPLAMPELFTAASAATPTGPGGSPAYYVSLPSSATGPGHDAQIKSTTSGQTLATVAPPSRWLAFNLATAAADDRNFVLGADAVTQAAAPSGEQLFTVRFDPQSGVTTRHTLPIRISAGAQEPQIALSPDGSELAYTTSEARRQLAITVFTLATGLRRTWTSTVPADAMAAGAYLTWAESGEVLRYGWLNSSEQQVMVGRVDTAAPPGPLPAVAPLPAAALPLSGVVTGLGMSARGTLLVTTRGYGSNDPGWAVSEFSGTAQVPGLGWVPQLQHSDMMPQVLWANPTGSSLIVRTGRGLGLISNGLYSPLPSPFHRDVDVSPASLAW